MKEEKVLISWLFSDAVGRWPKHECLGQHTATAMWTPEVQGGQKASRRAGFTGGLYPQAPAFLPPTLVLDSLPPALIHINGFTNFPLARGPSLLSQGMSQIYLFAEVSPSMLCPASGLHAASSWESPKVTGPRATYHGFSRIERVS